MQFDGFLGGSYPSAATAIDCQRSMNLYVEHVAADGGSAAVRAALIRAPGWALLQTLPDAPGRGAYTVNGRMFAVAGSSFFELLTPSTSILRGQVSAGTSPVAIVGNTTQLMILADGRGFLFTLASNDFRVIVSLGFPPAAVSGCSIDTYFIALKGGSNQFLISAPLDGLSWSALDFGSSQEPDNAVAVAANHLYLWIFGQNETCIFQDTGNASFPFQRVPGSQIEMGCAAVHSVCGLDNTLFWLGSSSTGPAVAYRAEGFLPVRVSHHALEAAMQSYPTVADATAYPYGESGHLFYRVDFPSANEGAGATWLYDVATKLWHERGYWNLATASYSADRARYHAFCFGAHITLDYTNGNVYRQSLAVADHAGNPLRWLRAAPHISDGQRWLFYSSFELDMQRGMGLDGARQGSDPVCFLRWSNDGGLSWSNARAASTGARGEFAKRVRWLRLGRARNRVFEVSGSDPIPTLAILGCEVTVEKGGS